MVTRRLVWIAAAAGHDDELSNLSPQDARLVPYRGQAVEEFKLGTRDNIFRPVVPVQELKRAVEYDRRRELVRGHHGLRGR